MKPRLRRSAVRSTGPIFLFVGAHQALSVIGLFFFFILDRRRTRCGFSCRLLLGRSPCPISAPTRCLDRGDVDLLHVHHRIEGAFCFIAAGGNRLHQDPWRDLPGDSPSVLAPAARTLLAATAHDCVPIAVGLLLILSRDLERESLVMFERWAAVETDTGHA